MTTTILVSPEGAAIPAYLLDTSTWPCTWLIEHRLACRFRPGDDMICPVCEDGGLGADECGAPSYVTIDGYECLAGHDFVTPEARQAQGWDYAGDAGEALLLARAGVEPRHIDGHVWAGPLPW